MESITKNRQPLATVQAMVARAYGPGEVSSDVRELGEGWFFMEFVDAGHLGAFDAALGATNRQLNEIRGDWFGALGGPGEATWRAYFTGRLAATLGDGERRGIDLGLRYEVVREMTATHLPALDEVVTPRFVELLTMIIETDYRGYPTTAQYDLVREQLGRHLFH
ncbi:hypothetical protein OWR29_08680 [Actinoplanes sp. Pm04-4]|uniref:Uncharacterized protein n=1 Tax=Paractinoplanes pyxinae TaxID=2997416 RepID=A0ABT4AUZ1_9ACTN|nr:hypothetical protein [Actinoplanes pyxinae]MCY1138069.1 hypothetical protein [Actinoplanes pyxinae]